MIEKLSLLFIMLNLRSSKMTSSNENQSSFQVLSMSASSDNANNIKNKDQIYDALIDDLVSRLAAFSIN